MPQSSELTQKEMSTCKYRILPVTCPGPRNSHQNLLFALHSWNQCVSSLTGFSTLDVYGRKLVDEFVSIDFKDSVSDILKNALMGIETAK